MDQRVGGATLLSNDLIDHVLGLLVLLGSPLNEDIPHVGIWDLFLRNLDFGAALLLEVADGLAAAADDQTHAVVRDWDDIGIRRRRTVRGHHAVVESGGSGDLGIVQLCSDR